jgi:hypothetical protein
MVGAKVGVSVLCPGFVKTNISTSERNRPEELRAAVAPTGPAGLAATMQGLVDSGQPPDAIADRVVAAILEPRFYVLTHPEMKPSIARRMKEVLEEQTPSVDPMLRKLLGG